METNVAYIIGAFVVLLIFIFIAKRLLRLAIKMVLVGIVIVALLAGAGYGWWNGWFDSQSKSPRKPGPARTASPR
jgi:VIT1/CCC1 family predicted Fe2+/Mn2+ transporter